MLFVLPQVSYFLTFMYMPKAEDVMMLSVGALLGILKGEGRMEHNEDGK